MSKLKKRMAGKKLDERFGKGFTDRTKAEGTQDPTKRGKESLKEALARFRTSGVKIDEGPGNLRDEYQARADSGDKFNSRAQEYLERHGVVFNRPEKDGTKQPVTSEPNVNVPIGDVLSTVPPIQRNPYVNDIDDSFNDFDDSFNNTNDQKVDYRQTQNINYHDFQDFNVGGDGNYINAPVDASNSITGGDVIFAQRNPMDFKNMFMQKLFN